MPARPARVLPIVVALLALLIPARADAWGEAGHRIIARIAEDRLTPAARRGVHELIGDLSLADVANWADSIRSSRRCTAAWHYIDIPFGDSSFDPLRDCIPCISGASPDSAGCIIAVIDRLRAQLADSSMPREARAEALKFIVHLVGDLHQPLHAADRGDRGGNDVIVTLFGVRLNPYGRGDRPWNLHAVWDAGLIDHAGRSEDACVTALEAWIAAHAADSLALGAPLQWALESHALAASVVYALPEGGAPIDIADGYAARAMEVIDERLARGGVRLAAMLNEILRSSD
jgi:hypothetical protein